MLQKQAKTGKPRKTDLRKVINALRYMVRSGCECRMLPNDFPPYQTVYYWLRRLLRRMLFRTTHHLALMLDRLCNEREVLPRAGVVDSQSVKAPATRTRGANRKVSGRKRHIAVDTDGRLLAMNLAPPDIADCTGAQMLIDGWVNVGHG